MRVIIVGAGGTARELLRGLADHWEVAMIDPDQDRLERAAKIRAVTSIVGDGSSRVVLDRVGIDDADAVIATTNDDDVNLEVCRIALDEGVGRVAAVARDPDHLENFRNLGVPVFSRARLTARRIEMQVEPRRVASAGFADGMAEAIEFRITDDSPLRGKTLRDLHSETWLVAAVLRDGRLIVPHGNTGLRAGDLVTVVGAASDYSAMVEMFTGGEAQFPLDYGKKVVVAAEHVSDVDGHVAEAAHFVHASAAEVLVVIHEDPTSVSDSLHAAQIETITRRVADLADGFEVRTRPIHGHPHRELAKIVEEEGAGTVVLPAVGGGGESRTRPTHALSIVGSLRIPVLISAGTHKYRRILVPARGTDAGRAAARAAIDLAVFGAIGLEAIAVVPPAFLSKGADNGNGAETSLTRIRDDAAVHGINVRSVTLEGNPVRMLESRASGDDLLVLGVAGGDHRGRRIVHHLIRRSPASVLLVPDHHPAR